MPVVPCAVRPFEPFSGKIQREAPCRREQERFCGLPPCGGCPEGGFHEFPGKETEKKGEKEHARIVPRTAFIEAEVGPVHDDGPVPQVQGVGDFADARAERMPEDAPGPAVASVADQKGRPRDGRNGRITRKGRGGGITGKGEQDAGPPRQPQPAYSPALFRSGGSQGQETACQEFPGAAVKQVKGLVMLQIPHVVDGGEQGERQGSAENGLDGVFPEFPEQPQGERNRQVELLLHAQGPQVQQRVFFCGRAEIVSCGPAEINVGDEEGA